jgi:ribosome maturation factor RimP
MTKIERIEQVAQPIAARHGCDVVQISYRREQVGWVLRALIERLGSDPKTGSGIDHGLCAAVSRELGAALEEADVIAESFVLEVSSPGIERPLTRLADYERFKGREARIETSAPVGGRKRFRGVIGGARDGEIFVTLSGGDALSVSFEKISKAHLVFESDGMHFRAGER